MPSFFKDFRRKSKTGSLKTTNGTNTNINTNTNTNSNDANSHSSSDTNSNDGLAGNPDIPQNKSSSTLSSMLGRATAQSPPLRSQSSTNLNGGNGTRTPPSLGARPSPMAGGGSSRYSIAVSQKPNLQRRSTSRLNQLKGMSTTNGSPKPGQYTSPLAPRIVSVSEGSWVTILSCLHT